MRNDLQRQGSSNLFDDLGKTLSMNQKGKVNSNAEENDGKDIKLGFKRKHKDITKSGDQNNAEEAKIFGKKVKK